jgi:hypothetical protein
VKVDGTQYPKTFPALATFEEMQQWRRDEITRRSGAIVTAVAGSFADDVQAYLRLTAASPSKDRAAHLELWLHALGRDQPRRSITVEQVQMVLNKWCTEPPPPRPATPTARTPARRSGGLLSVETVRNGARRCNRSSSA